MDGYLRSYFTKEYAFVRTNVSAEEIRKCHIHFISSPIKTSNKIPTTFIPPKPILLQSFQPRSITTSNPIISQPDSQVFCQELSHNRSLVNYLYQKQVKVQQHIQFNHPSTIPQVLLLKFLQLCLLKISELYQHMYQVRSHSKIQLLCQTVHQLRSIVYYHHLYQAQVHQRIQVKNPEKIHQG